MASVNAFLFGVEIELLIRPKHALSVLTNQYGYQTSQEPDQVERNRGAIHKALAQRLTEGGLLTKLGENEGDFSTWLIVNDKSIQENSPNDGYCESEPNFN
jgi:hypothetical protein